MNTTISMVQGERRSDNIAQALELISDQVSFSDCQRVLIKPNLSSSRRPLAVTHIDAVRACLEFVRAHCNSPVVIADGSGVTNTWESYQRFGYQDLAQHFGVQLVDLNADQGVPVQVYDAQFSPLTLHLARTVVESDFRISVCPPKTHESVMVTLTLKNMVMGALINSSIANCQGATQALFRPPRWAAKLPRRLRHLGIFQWLKAASAKGLPNDKVAMHQGTVVQNINLARLVPWVRPQLAVIDGFAGMEGAGPLDGEGVDWKIALAGTDALAVDWFTTSLMGFDPAQVGYLDYCRRLAAGSGGNAQVSIRGEIEPERVRRTFKPHPQFRQQHNWHLADAERWLLPLSG